MEKTTRTVCHAYQNGHETTLLDPDFNYHVLVQVGEYQTMCVQATDVSLPGLWNSPSPLCTISLSCDHHDREQ